MSESQTTETRKLNKPAIIAASAAVILFALLLIVLLVPDNKEDQTSNETTATSEPTSSETTANADSGSSCGAGISDNTDVIDAAPETTWQTLPSGWIIPHSETIGALQENNGLLSCYEHSASGALFSATNTFVQLNTSSTMNAALDELVTDSPGKELAQNSNEQLSNRTAILKGYKYVSYAPDEATVQLLWGVNGGTQNMAITLNMVWENGDWKLRLPDNGDMSVQQVTDSSDFIKWGA